MDGRGMIILGGYKKDKESSDLVWYWWLASLVWSLEWGVIISKTHYDKLTIV